jgi:transposase-like protein
MCRVLESVMEGNNSGLGSAKKSPRGSWTMAQKQQAVAESNLAGANVAEVAKRHGVRPALLSSWRRQLSPKAGAPKKPAKFAAVRVGAAPVEGMIEIDLAGGCVRVRGIVDAGMLREVLAAAR